MGQIERGKDGRLLTAKIFSRLHAARLDGKIKTRPEEVQIAQQMAITAD